MIKIDMDMPKCCEECRMNHIDECGDFLICGITHAVVLDLYNKEHKIEYYS